MQGKSPRIDIETIKQYQSNNFDGYDGWAAYQQSKLGNILLAKEFAKRFPNMVAVSLHPGGINTKLARHTRGWSMVSFYTVRLWQLLRESTGHLGMKSVEAGAATTVTCATLPKDKLVNGGYYEDCDITTESESAKNEEDAAALYDFCEAATKEFQGK
jgi:NAD(P)-dependent dehydrogenase (short-subunit alcohol dehydrogenase family)